MQSQCFSSTLIGIESRPVTVEAVVANGLPGLTLVGLPDASVSEAGARVRSALKLSGIKIPPRRIVINLSPADLKKSGSGFDLALALSLLEALGEIPPGSLKKCMVVGELSLGGEVRAVRGLVSSLACAIVEAEMSTLIYPACQEQELPQWEGVVRVPVESLGEAIAYMLGEWAPAPPGAVVRSVPSSLADLSEVKGQEMAKLALEVCAAGGHHLAFIGPPGCGKSLLAKCLPSILPPLSAEEEREVALVASVCGEEANFARRPFRQPGPVLSSVGLLGGRLPGEATRAHRGVLFLDEFPEFRRDTLESLRTVLESGVSRIVRANFQTVYPAALTLLCALNPCPCGKSGEPGATCLCSESQRQRYLAKLSGPLMDRLDLMVGLSRLPLAEMGTGQRSESSQTVRERVVKARSIQDERGLLNRNLRGASLQNALGWSKADKSFCLTLADREKLSMRAFEKWLKVARTVADLDGGRVVKKDHLMVARSIRFVQMRAS